MSEHEYTIEITGPGLELTRAVDQATALSVMTVVMGGGAPGGAGTPAIEASGAGTDMTSGEFLATLNTPGNAEKIAGILLYAREQLDQARLPTSELPGWFQRAGEAPPKNLTRDVRKAVSKRLISEDPAHEGEYFVTQTGVDALRSKPSQSTPPRTARSSPPRPAAPPAPTAAASSTSSAKQSKRRRRSATAAGSGPMDRIRALIAAGWFDDPRTMQDLLDQLARRGASYRRTDLTRQMQTLTQNGELDREQRAPKEGGREIWHYSSPS